MIKFVLKIFERIKPLLKKGSTKIFGAIFLGVIVILVAQPIANCISSLWEEKKPEEGKEEKQEKPACSYENPNFDALRIEIQQGNLREVKCLINHGEVSPDAMDENNQKPLHIAAKAGYIGIVEFLIDDKGVFNSPINNDGYTPRDLAIKEGASHWRVRWFLNDIGAKCNTQC